MSIRDRKTKSNEGRSIDDGRKGCRLFNPSFLRQSGGSAKVVFDPDNVVLAKIVASLDLNKDKRRFTGIFDPMGRTNGDVDSLAGRQREHLSVERDICDALDDYPVFASPGVFLVTQAFRGVYADALDLIIQPFFENGV